MDSYRFLLYPHTETVIIAPTFNMDHIARKANRR
jgi:hypothetical protein